MMTILPKMMTSFMNSPLQRTSSHFSLPGRILSPTGLPVTGSSSNLDFTMMVKTICKDRREKEEGLEEEEGMLG